MYISFGLQVCKCTECVPDVPEEGARYPGLELTESCELPVGAGNRIQVLQKSSSYS